MPNVKQPLPWSLAICVITGWVFMAAMVTGAVLWAVC